tara:strand:+ start:56 stop:976 length:921 start_codon:yes stop_codon:yes gene_type:complete
MTATKKCAICKGNHTDIKCPRLDGYIKHINTSVQQNTPTYIAWTDADYQRANGNFIWRTFIKHSTVAQRLGISAWGWSIIIDTYCKKQNYRAAGLKRRGKKRLKAFKCGYCRTEGHTRRKCPSMQSDITIAQDASKMQRAMFLEKCKTLGLGIGTLVQFDWTSETRAYSQYHSDVPKSVMAVITSLPVSSINPFIRLERWNDMVHFAEFGIKIVNTTVYLGKRSGIPTSFHLAKGILNGEFDDFTPNFHGWQSLNRYYRSKIIAPSKNLGYSTIGENDYLDIFRKYPLRDLQHKMEDITKWLKENS